MKISRNMMFALAFIIILSGVSVYEAVLLSQQASSPTKAHVLYEITPFNTVSQDGLFYGYTTFSELKQHGDFGIGTIINLDGEMLAFNGTFYNIKSDGKVYIINDTTETPYACVTFFEANMTIHVDGPLNYTQFTSYLDTVIPSKNLIYAIEVHGTFSYVKARAPAAQSQPYPPLLEALKNQSVFEFYNITGTASVLRLPSYLSSVNAVGYHMHFINDEKTGGGHVLDWVVQNVTVKIDYISQFEMELPNAQSFYQAD